MDLPNRTELEQHGKNLLLPLMEKQRRELVALMGSPPLIQNVPESFWIRIQREQEEELFALCLLVFVASARQHGLDEGAALVAGRQYAAGQSLATSVGMVDTLRERVGRKTEGWADVATGPDGLPTTTPSPAEIEAEIEPIWGESKAEQTSVTETTGAHSAGGEGAVKELGLLNDQDQWMTERDARVCPVCRPLDRTTRDVWSRQFPTGPPAHVSCRCFLQYRFEKEPGPNESDIGRGPQI